MFRKWTKFNLFSAVLLSLTVWGCESLSDPTQPQLGDPNGQHASFSTLTSGGKTVVRESELNAGTVSATIDKKGGRLILGSHVLEVPSGAVDNPTLFTMDKVDADHIQVKLTATRLILNDVGSRGFNVPVRLTLSYGKAAELPSDQSTLRVIWVKLDGTSEDRPSTVDVQGKRVTASLGHFSNYALAFP